MPRHITIIGMGLIGSSLARALKTHPTTYEVTGADASLKTVEISKKLGLASKITNDLVKASAQADMVVLATPLSAYASVMEKIAPHLKTQAVITDVGSVKGAAIESILPFLSNEQRRYFVPAHPIAGTENSGPEAGKADLFKGKKVIITPLSFSEREAISEVMDMWEDAGSAIEVMETRKHDEIYALVSHMVQLLCSAAMMAITILPKESYREIQQRMDNNFRAFIRLAGSDPVMWRDIFSVNSAHIEAVVRRFSMYFISLVRMVEAGDNGGLKKRLESARKKRDEFYSRLHHTPAANDLVASDYGPAKSYALSYLELLPVLISTAIMDSVPEEEYEHAAGAGFYGFTRSIVIPGATDVTRMLAHRKAVVVAAEGFLQQVDFLMIAVKKGQLKMLEESLARARESYHILLKK